MAENLPVKSMVILRSWFIGVILNASVWGISCVQTFTFYMRNPGDRLFLRVLIGSLWCMNTFNFCLNIHSSYFFLVTGYGHPASLTLSVWSVSLHIMSAGVMAFIIRSMYTRRVYLLSNKNKLLTTILVILSLFSLASWEYLGAVITVRKNIFPARHSPAGLMLYCSLAVVEFCIAISLCYYLYTSRGTFRRTNSIIHTLMLYSVKTGLIVIFFSTAVVILAKSFISTGLAVTLGWLITKVYFCCYLFSLNAREDFRRGTGSDDVVSIHLSCVAPSTRLSKPAGAGEKDGVLVLQTVELSVDATQFENSPAFGK